MNSSAAARLCQAHLLALGPDADPSALADVVWLGLQLTLRGAAAPDGTIRPENPGSAQGARNPGPIGVPDGGAQKELTATANNESPDSLVPLYPLYFAHPFGKVGASRINIPAGEPLPQRLRLERALKPFKRRLPSLQQRELDPIATAEASAEWRSITPVYRASPERWFEVAILAEASDAMHIWDATLLELRRMLARHGAFRRVRLWRYAMRKDALILSTPSAAVASPKILVDPQGRRLCWFVTTGTSPLWQHAALIDLIATLGRYGPTTIVQLMPYHTWPHTLLGDASEEALGHAPGTPTARLRLRDPFTGELERAPDALTVPVTSLEPARLETWARFSMASRRVPHAAIRLETAPLAALSPTVPRLEAAPPRQRIAAFRAIASSPAFQLLRLLSGMPLSLPVMRLMQMGMPDRAQVHLAEVLLSGLIERVSPPDADLPADSVEYDFVPGIRKELLDSLTLSEGKRIDSSLMQIAEQARRFVEAFAGSANTSFSALVHDRMGDERLLEQAKSFLSVSQNFRPLPARGRPQTEGESGAGTIQAPSPAVQHKTEFNFLSEEGIKEQVLRASVFVLGASELRCLLFFATGRQHSWLVASDHAMALVLDDAETRRDARLVQRTCSWLDALPVAAKQGRKGESVVNFGTSDAPGWFYSQSLFPSPRGLEEAIVAMAPGGRDGTLMQLGGLALKYDEMRASARPGPARTLAMQDLVDQIAAMPPLLEPDVTLATQSKSAGIRLIAIVALQRSFHPDRMGWLFDCIDGDQAFLAFQAALALQQSALALSKQEQVRMQGMAVDTKHKLQAAGLDDINVHRLLDRLAALPGARRSAINGGEIKRILIGSTGWELADYRALAAELLQSLGHEIIDEPVMESASELQTRLNQFESCDMVLLLVGTSNEYGQVGRQSAPKKMLLVEFEYQQAVRLRKPVMVFMLKDESFSGSSPSGEPDRMAHFRQTLLSNHVVKMVQSPEEFEGSLYRELQKYSVNGAPTVEQVVQNRNRKPEGMQYPDPAAAAGRVDSTPGEVDNAEEIDVLAVADAFGKLVRAGAVTNLNPEVELALNHAVESAHWFVDADSYFFYETDDEHGQLLRWEFASPSPDVFEPTAYRDETLCVTSTIRAWIEVHCSFMFSVKDSIDKDMVPMGHTTASRTIKVLVEVEIEVHGVLEGLPEVESVEVESISEHVGFGNIEPDSYEDISDD
ncbi:SAV_2336 N-terminal domain-related protein (plasmid) [Cupriavidus metallidurans]|uniref:SAV_2336 N-terminal domain-related protein n=1 Tax=Cupriavidus metallidurans TaxID=119219 RepID=UPI003D70C539